MPCVDKDVFNLADHGHEAIIALDQLLKVPKIGAGVLGVIINLIKNRILNKEMAYVWVPDDGKNAGNAISLFKINNNNRTKIEVKGFRVTVMEGKRSQLIHELVHCLDVSYYFYNIDHPPLESWHEKRFKYLAIDKVGQIIRYGEMMGALQANKDFTDTHGSSLVNFIETARNNNLLKKWQWEMLLKQLTYANQWDKLHVEFTANVAQCLCLLYQWGFTGDEKGLFGYGNPRSIAILITNMERALRVAISNWTNYIPPERAVNSVYQMNAEDKYSLAQHYYKDKWWETEEPLISGILEPVIPGITSKYNV